MKRYEIVVDGVLDERWSSWFGGLEVRAAGSGTTVVRGAIEDQAALHGVLSRINGLGLELVSVRLVDDERTAPRHDRVAGGRP